MMIKIEKNEYQFIARFWLSYLFAGFAAITVMLLSGAYKTVCLSSLPITAAIFYFVFSALVGYVFIFTIWLSLLYYRLARGIEYIGVRYFWPMYACVLFGLGYSAFFLKYVNTYPGTMFSHFNSEQFLTFIQKYHCAAVSFLFEDFPLKLLMSVAILTLPVIYYLLLRLNGKTPTQNMNSRGAAIKSKDKLPKKYIYQLYFHLVFITVLLLLACYIHYLIFVLL